MVFQNNYFGKLIGDRINYSEIEINYPEISINSVSKKFEINIVTKNGEINLISATSHFVQNRKIKLISPFAIIL